MNIYELTTQFLRLQEALIESGGALTEEQEKEFDELTNITEEKLQSYRYVILNMKGNYESVKSERQRLQDMERSLKNAYDNVVERVFFGMQAMGIEEKNLKVGFLKVVNVGGKLRLTVTEEADALPEDYQVVRVSANNEAIREALESGEQLPFAYFEPRGKRLSVK